MTKSRIKGVTQMGKAPGANFEPESGGPGSAAGAIVGQAGTPVTPAATRAEANGAGSTNGSAPGHAVGKAAANGTVGGAATPAARNGAKSDPPPSALALRPPSEAMRHPTLARLLDLVRTYSHPSDTDIEAIERAYRFAEQAHDGQT